MGERVQIAGKNELSVGADWKDAAGEFAAHIFIEQCFIGLNCSRFDAFFNETVVFIILKIGSL